MYVRILISIFLDKYQDQNYRNFHVTPMTRQVHFLLFLLLGPLFLTYRILVTHPLYLIRRAMEEVPEIYTLIFNREMYHLFKKTLRYFLYERRLKEVRVAEMTGQLDTYYLESTYRSALNQ